MKYTTPTNYLIAASIVVISLLGCQKKERTSYIINGTVEAVAGDSLAVLLNVETRLDTLAIAKIENGTFKMEGSVDQPIKAGMYLNDNYIELILENAIFDIDMKNDAVTVTGGELSTLVYGYKSKEDFQKAAKDSRDVAQKVFSNLDMMDKDAVVQARSKARKSEIPMRDITKINHDKILNGDYPTMAKLYVLSDNYDWKTYDMDQRMLLYKEYDKALGGNAYAQLLFQRLEDEKMDNERRKSVEDGKPFKEVIAHTLEGDVINLSAIVSKNKYTLLEMWASWCGPCRGEFPHLKKSYAKYHPKGFEIYGLSIDEDKDRWVRAMEEEDVPWINVVDFNGFDSKAAVDYVVNGIPASFLIDQNGTIVASGSEIRGFSLDEKLKELFD